LEAGSRRRRSKARSCIPQRQEPPDLGPVRGSVGPRHETVLRIAAWMRGAIAGCAARETTNAGMTMIASSRRAWQGDRAAAAYVGLHALCGELMSMTRLAARLGEQMREVARLDAATAAELKEYGHGG